MESAMLNLSSSTLIGDLKMCCGVYVHVYNSKQKNAEKNYIYEN